MPAITPVLPSQDAERLKAQAEKLIKALQDTGAVVDFDGFARAWMSDSVRAVVAQEGDTYTGLAVMVQGRRWFDPVPSATILVLAGPARAQLLPYLRDMAAMLGAQKLYWDAQPGDPFEGEQGPGRVLAL
jgi:hypothetical protein